MPKTVVDGMLDVYVVQGKKRPKKVGQIAGDAQMPPTYVHEGTTYYLAVIDISRRTVTFTSVPATWQ